MVIGKPVPTSVILTLVMIVNYSIPATNSTPGNYVVSKSLVSPSNLNPVLAIHWKRG